jgi:hypothetical protein
MLSCPSCANKAIPKEYRKIAEDLFPPNGYAKGEGPSLKKIQDFAEILGLGPDYKQFLETPESDPNLGPNLEGLLLSFQNNLDLLIQKTWVEKADEGRKDDLSDQVPDFIAKIEQGNYSKALEEFGAILEELAWLFFGAQSQKDDFTEYTFRIDTQIGLFWWYGNQLCSKQAQEWIKGAEKGVLKAILLLGISYLTNF